MTEWLFDTLVATSALLLLVLMVRGFVARSFGPSVAYWLWLLPAARLFMPSLTEEVAAPAASPVSDIVRDAALAVPVQAATAEPAMAAAASMNWTGIGLTFWLGGAALLFIVQMIRYVSLRDELLTDATEIDRIGDISVVASDRIGGPLAFGLYRRYIAVPDHFTRTFNAEERDLALAHELAHHRSGDLFANLAAFMVLCLMWFNPLAWMAWSAFRFDQEAACDARVLAGADAGTRHSYGRALARAASSDRMPTLAMAMALNNPRSIIERLRRLMMKDTSKKRLFAGRAAIFAAAAIALPLTATVVPVFAEDKPAESTTASKQKTKIVIVKGKDGQTHKINVSGDADTPFVKTIEKDGKTIVLRSSKEMSDAEIDKLVAEAEESRAKAEAEWGEAEAARGEAEAARGEAEAAKGEAQAARAMADGQLAFAMAMIPEIDIREVRGNCKEGHPVSTDVNGFDGKNKSRVRIVMCGKGQAKQARLEAIKGLQEAQREVESDKDIPDSIRKSVLDSLEKQIDRMEDQLSKDDEPDSEA
jgi:bla regulator protein blaR1